MIERGLHTVFSNQVTHCYRGLVATIGGLGGEFGEPQGAAVAANGDILVADSSNHRIRRITPATVVSTVAGDGTPAYLDGTGTGARFNSPHGVAVAPNGDLLAADRGNHRIRRITPAGIVTTVAGNGTNASVDGPAATAQFSMPLRIDVAIDGTFVVADAGSSRIRRIL